VDFISRQTVVRSECWSGLSQFTCANSYSGISRFSWWPTFIYSVGRFSAFSRIYPCMAIYFHALISHNHIPILRNITYTAETTSLNKLRNFNFFFLLWSFEPIPCHCLHLWDFAITLIADAYSVRPLWMSDQPDAEDSTCQHTTLTTDKHPCPRRN